MQQAQQQQQQPDAEEEEEARLLAHVAAALNDLDEQMGALGGVEGVKMAQIRYLCGLHQVAARCTRVLVGAAIPSDSMVLEALRRDAEARFFGAAAH
jgi:hypothetical protein